MHGEKGKGYVSDWKVKPMPFQKRKARQMKYYCGFCYCSSVAKSRLTFWAPVDCSTADIPAFTISQSLLKLMSIGLKMSSNHLILCHPLPSCPQSFPASGSFPMSWLFASGGQSPGASASASALLMNIQGWFPLGWTGLISLLSKVHHYLCVPPACLLVSPISVPG